MITATGNIEDYLLPGQHKDDENLDFSRANIIYKTCREQNISIDEFLTGEKIKELSLSSYDKIELIKLTGNIEKYLTPEKIIELDLINSDIESLIKATGNIEDYLLPEQHVDDEKLSLSFANILYKTDKIKEYLTPEITKKFNFSNKEKYYLIKKTGNIEEYLTPEKIKELNLDQLINDLIKETEKAEDYLLPGQHMDDERLFFTINNVIYKTCREQNISIDEFLKGKKMEEISLSSHYIRALINKELFSEKTLSTLNNLLQKNSTLYSTINFDILFYADMLNTCREEQLLRITHYPEVQDYILRNNNPLVFKSLEYLMQKDENWIISFNRIMENENQYTDLINNLRSIDNEKIKPEFIENFLCVISDSENYFDIQNYEDVANYTSKKNDICLNILQGNLEDIPPKILYKFQESEGDLYKFALLEYKFGIDLQEAKHLISRYGTDSDKLPTNKTSDYIRLLKTIIEHDNIQDVIHFAVENDLLEQPWQTFPNARNAEGKILNMFAELYNETLYSPKTEDKLNTQETYKDIHDKEYSIDIYEIKGDFNLNARVEGAYSSFIEPDNFKKYYENPNIDNHGNCESYIGNDSISTARLDRVCIIVGYKEILHNALTSCGPYDLGSYNTSFSIYNEKSDFRIPVEMINHTRHTHNEMVKDRIIVDKKGNAVKSKPDYIIWIEEDPKTEREQPDWKKTREKNKKWIMTKKAAAQLGVPIVVIDREYFAERETDKIDLLKKLITGENIDQEKYKEYYEQYSKLSKSELIEQLITKFENNRIGLQFNEKLNRNIFYARTIRKNHARNRCSNRTATT